MWPRRQDTVSRPARKPTALCPVDGLCFAWVPSDRAGRHSREEESFLPVRPWSAVDPFPHFTPVQVSNSSWVERSTGISPTITNSFARNRHRRADRGASGPFHLEDDPG